MQSPVNKRKSLGTQRSAHVSATKLLVFIGAYKLSAEVIMYTHKKISLIV